MIRRNTINLVPDKYIKEFLKALEYQAVRRKIMPITKDEDEIYKTRRNNNNDMQ